MGNQLKLPQLFNDITYYQNTLTQKQIKTKLKQVNHAFQQLFNISNRQNKKGLELKLVFDDKGVVYDRRNWRRSTIKGWIIIVDPKVVQIQQPINKLQKNESLPLKQLKQQQQHHHHSYQQKQTNNQNSHNSQYPIVISPQDLTKLHQQITSLSIITSHNNDNNHPSLSLSQQQQQLKGLNQPFSTPTPTPQQHQQQEQCCICLQNKTSMVLPCSHAFCDQCTIKYIIEAQQKKCPQCRHQIKGSRETVGRQIFTVVQDQQVFEQVRKDVLHVVGRMNSQVIKKVLKITGWEE